MGFVFDYGGGIATQVSGKWKGLLASPKSIAGLTAYKNFFSRRVAGVEDDRRAAPEPVRRLSQGSGRVDDRAELVHLLRRREVQGLDRAVRDAGPRRRHRAAGLPRRLRPRSADHEQATRRSRPTGSRTSRPRARRRPCRRRATSRTPPTCSVTSRQRARCLPQLVRPDREALGRRRERQHPPQHAGPDPHRKAVREAGGAVGERQHRLGAEPAVA